ncbi:hypothetical protein [Hyalangium sp.]|uniref:hypothetical protein n=1 Tax=Hyalangium sp. TaxID=2028555 RepID=UPI002D368EC7|nr:hypothetical protein [Hyalangium sp.]HYH98545.1 hypothetical protein [Hyalangium sp.]
MPRLCSLALLVLLASTQLGGSCSEPDAVPLEELQKDITPPFDYALYCDENGTLVGSRSAVLLVYRAAHLERVYADSRAGNSRAQALFEQLEATLRATGQELARKSLGIACGSLPACVAQWHKLDEFMPSRGEGGMRLRQVMADSFSQEAKLQHVRNTTIAAVLDVLLVGTVLRRGAAGATEAEAATAEARTAAAEAATPVEAGRLALAGLEARIAAEELAALEARLAEAEALETAARHPQSLKELARHRPASSQPPSGIEAEHPRWTSYVAYWHRRYEELAGTRPLPPRVPEAKPPLTWNSYSGLLNTFQRSLEFQRAVTRWLQQAEGSRQCIPGMKQPLVTDNTGLQLEGRAHPVYVDQLAVDQATLGAGRQPSVHSFSNKQHSFSGKGLNEVRDQLKIDSLEARTKYSGVVEVRRRGHPLFGQKVRISRVHIVYDATTLDAEIRKALLKAAPQNGVDLHLYVP